LTNNINSLFVKIDVMREIQLRFLRILGYIYSA